MEDYIFAMVKYLSFHSSFLLLMKCDKFSHFHCSNFETFRIFIYMDYNFKNIIHPNFHEIFENSLHLILKPVFIEPNKKVG